MNIVRNMKSAETGTKSGMREEPEGEYQEKCGLLHRGISNKSE